MHFLLFNNTMYLDAQTVILSKSVEINMDFYANKQKKKSASHATRNSLSI